MRNHANCLPGLDLIMESSAVFGNPQHVHLGDLSRFSDAVLHGLRRELERLEFGGIPAFARGKHLHTPQGSILILPDGQASPAASLSDFGYQARIAACRMASDNDYSYNRTFANQYLTEAHYA